jgi:hypothetical protein
MNLRETAWVGREWIHFAQNRDQWWVLLNVIMNFGIPKNVGKLLSS